MKRPGEVQTSRRHAAAAIVVTAFVLFIMLRSGTAQGYATLLPAYFATQGLPPERFGIMLGIFAFAGAFGTLLGGFLGDRFNRKYLMVGASILSAPFALMMLYADGIPYVITAILAGLFLSIPHSILVVMTQELAPHRRGLVGGLVLGFIFASGSTMAWLEALAADQFGLQVVLSVVALFPLAAGLIRVSCCRPDRRRRAAPMPVTPRPRRPPTEKLFDRPDHFPSPSPAF